MKYLITIAFISTCLFSFGQTSQTNMFWNNYSTINPAMSGFQYRLHSSATYNEYFPSLSLNYISVNADYGMNIAKNHGVGINYTGDFGTLGFQKAVMNYNYQFHFDNESKLAVGTGLGIGRSTVNYDHLVFGDPYYLPAPATNFQLNVGAAYNWKNLYLGFSATNLIPPAQNTVSSYYGPRTAYNFFAQYAFQITRRFQLTPRVLYTYENGFQRLRPNLELTYNEKFFLGVSSQSRDGIGVNLGVDIKNKLRVAYMYDVTISKLNNGVNGGAHEFSIGYLLKEKKRRVIVTPDF